MLASTEFDSRKLLTLICLVVTVAERGQKYDPLSVVRRTALTGNKIYKMLSYRRGTALQGALEFWPKVEEWN